MKVYSIGRDETCDIVINNNESLVSRKHALLKVYFTGKMELVDMSSNGTFVNGRAIARNKPYPVTRKDVITFARVKQLDWKQVPNQKRKIVFGVSALLVVFIAFLAFVLWPEPKPEPHEYPTPEPPVTPMTDKTDAQEPTTPKQDATEEEDAEISLEAIQDMLKKQNPPKRKDKKKDSKDDKDKKEKDSESNKDKSSSADKQSKVNAPVYN